MIQNLKHKQPFLFVDKVINYNSKQITGIVCFNDNKFNWHNKVDGLDLLEACGQLAGLHLSTIIQNNSIGYLSKIYYLNNMVEIFEKHQTFMLYSELLENIDDKYFIYESFAEINNIKVMSCKYSIIMTNNNRDQDIDIINTSTDYKSNTLFEELGNNRIIFNKNHFIFAGHFPGFAVVPGIYLIKISLELLNIRNVKSIENAKFIDLVLPEQEIYFQTKEVNNKTFVTIFDSSHNKKANFISTRE